MEVEQARAAGRCCFCGRTPPDGITEHHLVPRRCHANKWFKKRLTRAEMQRTIPLCRPCHRAVHRMLPSEKELGRDYASTDRLLRHEGIARHVAWMRRRAGGTRSTE